MNAKALITLAAILVILVGIVYLRQKSEQKPVSLVEQAALETIVPDGLDQDAIRKITLYSGDADDTEKVVLTRAEGDAPWRVASQFNAPALQEEVGTFLDTVFSLKGDVRETVSGDDGLDKYQLKDDQALHLALATDADAEPALHLLLGKQASTSTLFMRRDGEMKVYDEQAAVRQQTGVYSDDQQPTAAKWIDKVVFELKDDEEITSVATALPDKSFTIAEVDVPVEKPEADTSDEDGADESAETPPATPETKTEWQVTEGGPKADFKADTWTSNVNRLKTLRASDVVDPANLAEYGLDSPAYRTTIKVKGRTDDIVLEGGRPEKSGDGYIRVAGVEPPVVYKVYGTNFELAFPKTGTLFAFPKFADGATEDKLQSVEVLQTGNPAVVIASENDSWKVVQPALELPTQETALAQLAKAMVSEVTPVDYAAEGVETGPYNWTLTATIDGQVHTLHLGADSKTLDGVYARYDDDPAVYALSRPVANKLMVTPDKAFQTKLFSATTESVQGIVFEGPDQRIMLTKDGEEWQLADGPTTYKVDTSKARSLVSSILALQGETLRLDVPAALPGDGLYTIEVLSADGRTRAQFVADPADASKLLTHVEGLPVTMGQAKADLDSINAAATGVVESKQETPAAEVAAPATASDAAPMESPNTAPLQVDLAPIPDADAAALASPNTMAVAPAAQ